MIMHNAAKFWDKIAPGYAKQPIADPEVYEEKLRVSRGYLNKDLTVLELGCGTGSTALVHAPNVHHIHAIDISPQMIQIARAKATDAGIQNITFEIRDLNNLNGSIGSYDAVLALSVLHLLDNKEDIIRQVFKTLKPGGVFITSTACLGETMKFFKIVGPIGTFFGLLPTIRVFTPDDLRHSMTDAGFKIEHHWQPGRGKSVFIVAKKGLAAETPGAHRL